MSTAKTARLPKKPISLVVLARKGGVGKTTTATGVASVLAEKQPTLLIDLDAQGSASTALGIPLDTPGSAAALTGVQVEGAPVSDLERLLVWTGSPLLERVISEISVTALSEAIQNVRKRLPGLAVVIDCPPGNLVLEMTALRASNLAVAVTTIEPLALRTLSRAIAGLGSLPAAVVANKLRGKQAMSIPKELRSALNLPVFPIRQDVSAVRVSGSGQPLSKGAPQSRILEDIRELTKWVKRKR